MSRWSAGRWMVGGVLLALGFSACDSAGPAGLEGPETRGPLVLASSLPQFVQDIEGVLDRTAFSGTRVMESHLRDGALGQARMNSTGELLKTRQFVSSDGAGQFSILLEDPPISLPPGVDQIAFPISFERAVEAQWHLREFRVRNFDALLANYSVTLLGSQTSVAGIVCERVELVRFSPFEERPGRYLLEVDPATSFVLAMTEFDSLGDVLQSFRYESFEVNPDLSETPLRGSTFAGSPLDVQQPLEAQTGFTTLVPDILPDGFELTTAATFEIPSELVATGDSFLPAGQWVRMLASDGVEAVVFAHAEESQILSIGVEPATLRLLEDGSWSVAFGRVRGVHLVFSGRIGPGSLRRMIESSF